MDPVFPYGPNATRALSENRSQDLHCARRVCSIEPPRLACNLSCGQRRRRMLGRTTALCATRGFATEAACAAHRAKVHQSPAPAAAAVGTARQCCMREFWSRTRLREHLRRANRCARSYNAADVGIDDQPVPDDAHLPPSPDRASAILGAIFTTASGTCSCRCRSSFLARRRCQP